jgi:hypothetical protein
MPSEEQTYRKNIDEKLDGLIKTLEEQKNVSYNTANSLTRIEIKTTAIEQQVAFTNGKVRKIILALVLVFGILIGLGFTQAPLILAILGI